MYDEASTIDEARLIFFAAIDNKSEEEIEKQKQLFREALPAVIERSKARFKKGFIS